MIIKQFLGFFLFTITFISCQTPSRDLSSSYKFPDSEIGQTAKLWFQAMNESRPDLLQGKMKDDFLYDFVSIMQSHVSSVSGITPVLTSYTKDNFISIYTKENTGGWVKVNISAKNGVIDFMDMKKTFQPKDNAYLKGLDAEQNDSLISNLLDVVKNNYVIAEKGVQIASELEKKLKSKGYDHIKQGDLLARELTKDLREIADDRHLEIMPPTMESAYMARFGSNSDADMQSSISPINYEILNDSIGLISIERFSDNNRVMQKTDSIFENLSRTKAVIIDLRKSGGGDETHVLGILSYFFLEKEMVSKSYNRITNESKVSFTKPNKLSKSHHNKPLYILTSKQTISAAEALAYFL